MAQHPEAAVWCRWQCKALPLAATCSLLQSCDLKFTCKGWQTVRQTDSSQSRRQTRSESAHPSTGLTIHLFLLKEYKHIHVRISVPCRADGENPIPKINCTNKTIPNKNPVIQPTIRSKNIWCWRTENLLLYLRMLHLIHIYISTVHTILCFK